MYQCNLIQEQNTHKLNDWDEKQKQNIYYAHETIYILIKNVLNNIYLQIH
jgi:hypothetical protein